MPRHNLPLRTTFTPSPLSIPQTPFSPLSPLFPNIQKTHTSIAHLPSLPSERVPAPSSPLHWQWTCHTCASAYPLGATRRCLDDGHYFCAGFSFEKRRGVNGVQKRMKKHRACRSEFDYAGWKGRGRWKRSLPSSAVTPSSGGAPNSGDSGAEVREKENEEAVQAPKRKNCWINCDYPSQCRWGKSVGIHTPSPTTTSFTLDSSEPNAPMPSLDECFATSPTTTVNSNTELNASALNRTTEALSSDPAFSTVSTIDQSCIDPLLLVLSQPSASTSQGETNRLTTLASPFRFTVASSSFSRKSKNGRRSLSRCAARLRL